MPCSEWETAPIKDGGFRPFIFLRTKKYLIVLYTYTRVPGVFMMFHGFHFGINPSWTLFKHHIQIIFVTTTSVLNRIQYNNRDIGISLGITSVGSLKCSRTVSIWHLKEGILLLCQMVLERASKCSACGFPKRCQSPWLLRTHIGHCNRYCHCVKTPQKVTMIVL